MTQEKPLVTVICMCYNHQDYVAESLDSIREQSYGNIELIVCNDSSDDQSEKTIKNWIAENTGLNALFINNKTNLGSTTTFNNALRKSNGQYIIDLAADDFLLPHCIEMQMNRFMRSQDITLGIVYGNVKTVNENNNFSENYYPKAVKNKVINTGPTGYIFLELLSHNVVAPTSMLVKRDVFEYLNGYDNNLAYEDLDFWLRSSRHFKYNYIDEVLMVKRDLSHSSSNHFFLRTERGKSLRNSTYEVIKRTQKSLSKKEELKAIRKRLHYEIVTNYKAKLYGNAIRYILLKIDNHIKQIGTRY